MRINEVIWLDTVIDKLARKHGVSADEVEEVFDNKPKFRFAKKGNRTGEDVYLTLGQTESGRYLTVLFIYKINSDALILSARDMVDWERRRYERK
jgi:uncharacterized DUF497 family protein